MKLSKEQLEALTAGYNTPQEMESLYLQMLQHMINQLAGSGAAGAPGVRAACGRSARRQSPQWQGPQAGAEHGRIADHRDAARPRWHVRTAVGEEAPGSADGDGGEDPGLVRQGHDHA